MAREPIGMSREERHKLAEEAKRSVRSGDYLKTQQTNKKLRAPIGGSYTPEVKTGGVSESRGARSMQEQRMEGAGYIPTSTTPIPAVVAPTSPLAGYKPNPFVQEQAVRNPKLTPVAGFSRGDTANKRYPTNVLESNLLPVRSVLEQVQHGMQSAVNFQQRPTSEVPTTGSNIADTLLRGTGEVISGIPTGQVGGFGTIGRGVTQVVGKIGAKVLPSVFKASPQAAYGLSRSLPLASKVAGAAAEGATENVAIGMGAGQTSGEDIKNNALLGLAGGAFPLLGAGARTILNRFKKVPAKSPAPLGLPLGREDAIRSARGAKSGTGVVTPEYTFKLAEGDTSGLHNVRKASDDLAQIDEEVRTLKQQYNSKVIDEYHALKNEMEKRGGVQQGGIIRDPITGEVTNRYGRVSNNPEWYQEIFKELGHAPSNKELYALAQKRIDEGFRIEGKDVPGWAQENNYHETIDALESVREELSKSVGEATNTNVETTAPTKVNRNAIRQRISTKPQQAPAKPVEKPPVTGRKEAPQKAPEPKTEAPKPQQKAQTEVNPEVKKIDDEFKKYKETIQRSVQNGTRSSEEASRMIKGKAMRDAAEKRAIIQGDSLVPVEGGLTGKELSDKIARLKSNYTGKKVTVNGQQGTITKQSFGKVGVKFEDGSERFVDPDEVNPVENIDETIKRQTEKVKQEEPKQAEEPKQSELELTKEQQDNMEIAETVNPVATKITQDVQVKAQATPDKAPSAKPDVDDTTTMSAVEGTTFDEPRLINRLREQGKMDANVDKMIDEYKILSPRTTNARDLETAKAWIKRQGGIDAAFTKLMSEKSVKDSISSFAAKVLSAHYAKIGDTAKVYEIIKRIAPAGREAGQFIQSLKQWNLLDTEGVLLAANRQKNRLRKADNEIELSAKEQEKFAKQGGQLEEVQRIENELKSITDMIASKKQGEKFTEDEVADLLSFQKKVDNATKKVDKLRQGVEAQNAKTIKEVEQISPQIRKRDQIVEYLEAQADQAKKAWAKKRNLGFAQHIGEPDVVILSKIGASYFAKGIVKFSDWSAEMVKRGLGSASHVFPKVYVRAGDRWRKANGFKGISDLNKLINKAIKDKALDEATADAIRVAATEIGFATDAVKLELTRDLQRSLRNLGEVTLGEKIESIAYSAMLLSGRTHIRNIAGAVQQITLDKLVNAIASPIDWGVSKLTGKKEISFIQNNQEKLLSSYANGGREAWTGAIQKDTPLEIGDIMTARHKHKFNPFTYTEKLTGATLRSVDRVAYDNAYGRVVGSYATILGKSRGLTNKQIKAQMGDLVKDLDDKIFDISREEGERATYQNDNWVSKGAQGVKKALNYPTDKAFKFLRENGLPAWASLEGYGLGTVVTPFIKTPVNLILHGMSYSPLGFMRSLGYVVEGLGDAVKVAKKEKIDFKQAFGRTLKQRQFVQSLSKAIIGTGGFTMLGYHLYNLDILTGKASSDRDVRSLEDAIGRGAYKVNVSALYRYVMSGLDKEEAETKEGDYLMDYSWIQPVAISIGMGVSAAQAVDDAEKEQIKEEEAPMNYWKTGLKAIGGGMATILENPMVQGISKINDAFDGIKKGDWSKLIEVATSAPAQFVPAIINQVRQSNDNDMRETYEKGKPFNTAYNQVLNKIPSLSDNLPISYNSLGNPREVQQGGKEGTVSQYLKNMLSPSKVTKLQTNPESKLVMDMMNLTGDKNVLPRVVDRSITIKTETGKNKSINLNSAQFSQVQKETGEAIRRYLNEYESDLRSVNEPDEISAFMKKMLTVASKEGKQKMVEELEKTR